ncbi:MULTISPECIES: TlpA disulfide reductase family protein [unclassified Acinetobacter]|uniref:TlpA disulfide reductase family protein n=1 Tax=unclassified Acinetobacter TaxID=196816 RepID=UPI00293459C0|nr:MULTISPECIES: TlpA disulfide reductase family protein [unclassified Acinetobacter]WOE31546.1 TlpA disulfide reductase family protein [Acinetobacter sp. SAAs470]WOE39742.1 TlpA disulfide reductase family protein [Acinetobacter sp. SAAs474]
MMISLDALHIGPLMLPWPLLMVVLALLLIALMRRLSHTRLNWSKEIIACFDDSLWTAFIIGLLAARLGFVLLHWDVYQLSLIDIIKIQDQGFNVIVGILAGSIWFFYKNTALTLLARLSWLMLFILLVASGSLAQKALQHETHYPDLSFRLLKQPTDAVPLKQFIGQPTVINLWASWCPPCHREMPLLQQAAQRHRDVGFIMLNQGEDAQTIQQYLQQHQFNFDYVLLDQQGEMAQQMNMFGLPSTLFFNAQGQMVARHMGELTPAMLQQYMQKIIDKK